MHKVHLFNPEFGNVNEKAVYTRVCSGRFELLAVPSHLSQNRALASGPAALIDELLWLGKSELWSEMVGCFLEAGDSVLIPAGWTYRFRAILDKGAKPAIRLAITV